MLYSKMLKETETEETIGFFVTIALVAFQLGGGASPPPWQRLWPLDKMFYDDYLCLVASNKHQIQWTRIQKITGTF